MAIKFISIGHTIFLSNQNTSTVHKEEYFRMLFQFTKVEYCYSCSLNNVLFYSDSSIKFSATNARKVWEKSWF
jgi:hypothetical protein